MSDAPPPRRVLVCSVGGSPAPIRTALAQMRPHRVVFVVSDGARGPSSRDQVEQDRLEDGEPGLRRAEGCPEDVAILAVPADDPDRAFALAETCLNAEIGRGRAVTADYTGGTKSMSSALLLAATALPGVSLQFMQGERPDLQGVQAGSERPVALPIALVHLQHEVRTAEAFLRRRDYAAALQALTLARRTIDRAGGRKGIGAPGDWTRRLSLAHDVVSVLDHWDRFEHRVAWDKSGGSQLLPKFLEEHDLSERLEVLAEAEGKPHPALVEDLWLNAQRRAEAGRFDDAVARCYRLVEAAFQARLWSRHGIDTADAPHGRLPDTVLQACRPQWSTGAGRHQLKLSLTQARDTLQALEPRHPLNTLPRGADAAWQGQRNGSILAHGFRPLGERGWRETKRWFEDHKEALWEADLGRPTGPQLPTSWAARL